MKVFICHQKKDRAEAIQIVKYLKSLLIDVYFDEFDNELQNSERNNDPKGIVSAIKKGINTSTHMICIISPNSLNSKWVPFEVGYGYDITDLTVLTLKGINNTDLPDYIKTKPIIRDIYDINMFVKKHGNKYLIESQNFLDYSNQSHPLISIMDKIITLRS